MWWKSKMCIQLEFVLKQTQTVELEKVKITSVNFFFPININHRRTSWDNQRDPCRDRGEGYWERTPRTHTKKKYQTSFSDYALPIYPLSAFLFSHWSILIKGLGCDFFSRLADLQADVFNLKPPPDNME